MSTFQFFPTASVRPLGWLKKQLDAQADGLCGKLHTFWPDIADSAWIGGKADSWERVPYWLDGYIPLAWLLDRDDMKRVAKKYIDAILNRQAEDGWICPATDDRAHYDMWAYMLILKVLVVYHDATGDERIEEAVYRALQRFDRHIDNATLFGWGHTRWFEGLIAIQWMKRRRNEPWLNALALKLRAQGFDWTGFTLDADYPYREPCEKGRWSQMNHVVNNAMMIKCEALYRETMGMPASGEAADRMYDTLMRYHGMATGIFTGDENLNGNDPYKGTELCAVAELMYSFEHLLSATGDPIWADRLEWLAYNAWPATFTADMEAHQYVQQVNQPSLIQHEESPYSTNGEEAHLMGVEPNYGCCTSNFNQGWPKFVTSVFAKTARGVAIALLAPAELTTRIDGVRVKIAVDTRFPFGDTANIRVETSAPVTFELMIRIPGSGYRTMEERFEGTRDIPVELHPTFNWIQRPNDCYALTRGGLIFSQAIAFTSQQQDKTEAKNAPWLNNWEYAPIQAAAIGFARGKNDALQLVENPISEYPFSQEKPAVAVRVKCVNEKKELAELLFVPYGSTILRMTEMPLMEE